MSLAARKIRLIMHLRRSGITDTAVLDAIDPTKDVDGFHVINAGRLATGQAALVPCTPLGCLMLLRDQLGSLAGLNAVIVGRSNLVGKPLAALFLARNATVTAPMSGEVSDRQVNLGEAVSPGQTLLTVVNSTRLELAGQVPVSQATQVRAGQSVEFTMNAYPGRVFRGEVARVEPVADMQTRQVGVYVQLPNESRELVGGLFATGRVSTGASTESVVVPTAAVREAGAQPYVMVVEDGTVTRRDVTIGVRNEAEGVVAIESGLQGGEQVIVAPGQIQEGVPVEISGSAEPSPTAEEENDER